MTDAQPLNGPARFPNAAFDVVALAASAGGLQALFASTSCKMTLSSVRFATSCLS